MAEAIGLASGLLTLAVYALKSSSSLYETVQGYRDLPRRVRDLMEEIKALTDVLMPLVDKLRSTPDTDLVALKHPLLRCGTACKGFEEEIRKCFSRTLNGQTSFRDWAKLQYMSHNIDEVKLLFSGYRMTIIVALTDASLRKSTATAESIEDCKRLISTTSNDLKDRLELIDDKVERIVGKQVSESHGNPEAQELQAMKEERLSTQYCLKICAQLAAHIDQIQLTTQPRDSPSASSEAGSVPQKIANDSLQECKRSLDTAVMRLEKHSLDLIDRIMDNATMQNLPDDSIANVAKLREEWKSTREFMSICSNANKHLKENVTILKNSGSGDAIQLVVSTVGEVLQGNNEGSGWRSWQVGGHFNDESIQRISQDLFGRRLHDGIDRISQALPTEPPISVHKPDDASSEVRSHWGQGRTLTVKSPSDTTLGTQNCGKEV